MSLRPTVAPHLSHTFLALGADALVLPVDQVRVMDLDAGEVLFRPALVGDHDDIRVDDVEVAERSQLRLQHTYIITTILKKSV